MYSHWNFFELTSKSAGLVAAAVDNHFNIPQSSLANFVLYCKLLLSGFEIE